ncbi:MAG: LacI family DNA-binding transcriptional regulator [Lachnospiraceae bacterium]
MKDVARVAGVSIATVSRVLAGTAAVTDSTQKKVLAAMEELQYRTAAPRPARDPEGEPTHRRMHGKSHIAVLYRPAARRRGRAEHQQLLPPCCSTWITMTGRSQS